jgi:transketolase
VDGHDVEALAAALSTSDDVRAGRPHLIVAQTVAGKGVDFMQRRIEWHYLPMTVDQYASALAQVGETGSA